MLRCFLYKQVQTAKALALQALAILIVTVTGNQLLRAAQSTAFEEYQLKAGYLYNFISFTEWPESIGPAINLCVYGPDPFGAELDALANKTVAGHTLHISRSNNVDALTACQVVFVAREAVSNLARLMDVMEGKTVLLVADSEGAGQAGIALNMVVEAKKIGFEVNLQAAERHGLHVSYRLLRLAREVFK